MAQLSSVLEARTPGQDQGARTKESEPAEVPWWMSFQYEDGHDGRDGHDPPKHM